ncbi:MAG: lasso peptide biosynthesis B2 protein [Burkholderiaceae bacterium]
MSAGESWCLVPVDDHPPDALVDGCRSGLHLIYGPRLGRLYLLPGERACDRTLQRMLGLRDEHRRDALIDPVERIVCDQAGLSPYASARVGAGLRVSYRFLHRSRRYLPFRAAAALVQRAARRARGDDDGRGHGYGHGHGHGYGYGYGYDPAAPGPADGIDTLAAADASEAADASAAAELSRIGRRVRDLEQGLGLADCYPRALVTAYLCLLAGRDCTLTIGVLAPTRKMHAWCSTQALLPYEPLPEHYLYRPLWSTTLVP